MVDEVAGLLFVEGAETVEFQLVGGFLAFVHYLVVLDLDLVGVGDFVAVGVEKRRHAAKVLAEAADEDLLEQACLGLARVLEAVCVEVK